MSEKDVSTLTLDQVRDEIATIAPVLRKAFDEAGPALETAKIAVFGEGLDERQKSERIAGMNVRLHALGERKAFIEQMDAGRQAAADAEAWLTAPAGKAGGLFRPAGAPDGYKSLADLALADDVRGIWAKSGQRQGPIAEIALDVKSWLDREVKTVMSTGAGFAPQAVRTNVVIPAAYQMPTMIDLIEIVPTDQSAYVFMEQTTRTNNAAEAAESADGSLVSLAESAFAYTQVSETIRKIGHFVPVTDEQLEDIGFLESVLRDDMISGVRERLSGQILNGTGTAPQIEGLLDAGRTGVTDVTTTGEFIADAIDKLIEEVRVTGRTEPTAGVVNPRDWHLYRRATTADGLYIAGHPSENIAPSMWGLPLVLTTSIAQGTALVGDFRYARLAVKRGVEISISSEHASYFIQGVQAVKAEMRGTLVVYREAAFAKTNDLAA